jgi:hypothetical protein
VFRPRVVFLAVAAFAAATLSSGQARAEEYKLNPQSTMETFLIKPDNDPKAFCWANRGTVEADTSEIDWDADIWKIHITWTEDPGNELKVNRYLIDQTICQGTVTGLVLLDHFYKVFPDETILQAMRRRG